MAPAHYLCSQLVTLHWNEGAAVVNLEEIHALGAVLESEAPLAQGTELELDCGMVHYEGKVTETEEHAFGWRVSVRFSPLTPWSPEQFRPEHLLDPASVRAAKNSESEP